MIAQMCKKYGLVRDLNPGPLAPKARIIPLDQRAIHVWDRWYFTCRSLSLDEAFKHSIHFPNPHILDRYCINLQQSYDIGIINLYYYQNINKYVYFITWNTSNVMWSCHIKILLLNLLSNKPSVAPCCEFLYYSYQIRCSIKPIVT